MDSIGGNRWLWAMMVGLVAWAAAPAVVADTGAGQGLYGCDQAVHHGAGRGLVKTTDPPAGSRVQPGQEIRVELTWRAADWTGDELHKVLDCVTLDGKLSSALSGGEKPTANDGRFSHRYQVPADAAPGTAVCDRGFLSGPARKDDFARAESDVVCFTVERPEGHRAGDVGPPAVPPTAQPVAPPEVGGQRLPGAGSPGPIAQPAPVAAAPVASPAVPEAATQLPRTGGGPPRAALVCLAVAALARRRRRIDG